MSSLSDFINKQRVCNSLVLLLALAVFLTRNEALFVLWASITFIFIFFGFLKNKVNNEKSSILFISILFLTTLSLPYALLNSYTALFQYIIFLLSLSAAYIMRKSAVSLYQGVRLALYLWQFVIAIYLFYNGLDGHPLNKMLPDSSSNVVTSCLIVLQAAYSIMNFNIHRRVDIVPALITVMICIVGFGRGSIVISLLILIINIFYLIFSSKRKFIFSAVLVVFGLAMTGDRLGLGAMEYLNSNTKIGAGMEDSSRIEMRRDYFSGIDIVTFFSGANYDGTSIESTYNGNPHNSYIRGHHIFGIFYIFGIFLSLMFVLFLRIDIRAKFYIFSLSFFVLLRAASDSILFPTTLDVFFYAPLFALISKVQTEGFVDS